MTKPQLASVKAKELETEEGAKAFLEALGIFESEPEQDAATDGKARAERRPVWLANGPFACEAPSPPTEPDAIVGIVKVPKALQSARQHKQLAVFDLDKREMIYT